jgi:predicted dehydrogenase
VSPAERKRLVRIGQVGTRHGHARGKWQALVSNPDVETVGIWEPDARVRVAAQNGDGFVGASWCSSFEALLDDPTVEAVAIEGRNHESLAMAHAALDAGKHLWYDKPGGDDWPGFESLILKARRRERYVQMGYMFRYQPGFEQIGSWVRSGLLGPVYAIRALMSTWIPLAERRAQSVHPGGVFYDLAAHMLDQIVWLLGRPSSVTLFAQNVDTPSIPSYADDTVGVFEFERALAHVEIAAMEARPLARRFEVYGTRGSAITEPFDPGETLRLTLTEAADGYERGEQVLRLPTVTRQQLYERELAAFLGVIRDGCTPDRTPEHELLVQETLLRATGRIPS